MAATIRPVWIIVLVISFSYIFLGSCQQGSPQNIETFYPSAPPPPLIPPPPPSPPPATVLPPPSPPSVPRPPPPTTTGSSSSEKNTVVKAVVGTAAGSIAISALLIVLVRRHSRKKLEDKTAGGGLAALGRDDFTRFDRNIKGLIVDENGLDVLYWRNLQSGKARNGFRREVMEGHEEGGRDVTAAIENGSRRGNSDHIQEVPLLREKPTSNFNRDVEMSLSSGQQPFTSPRRRLTPRTTGTSSLETEVQTALAIPGIKSQTPSPPPPPPPPLVAKASNGRVPPPPMHGMTVRSSLEPEVRTTSAIPGVKSERPSPPPPPPMPKAGNTRPQPPPLPNGKPSELSGKNRIETGQVKMKPLHWDKVNANTDHSMVWNKIGHGSFK